MVESASSSNTQCPSGRRYSSNASVADAMLVSRSRVSIATDLLTECISLETSLSAARPDRKPGSPDATRSGPPHGKNKIGGAVSRPYRSLDGGRQPGIGPVAGEKQVFPLRDRARPQRILLGRGLEGGPALAHDLPGRQLALHAAGLADIPPDRLREFLARHVHQAVGIADGDRQPLRECKQPLHQPALDAQYRRHLLGRIDAEMR